MPGDLRRRRQGETVKKCRESLPVAITPIFQARREMVCDVHLRTRNETLRSPGTLTAPRLHAEAKGFGTFIVDQFKDRRDEGGSASS